MAMGDAKPLVLIPMPSRDRDLLVPTAAVATHASPSARSVADSDDDESKPSSASAAAQTGREVAALPSPLPPTPASLRMTVASRVRFGLPEKCQCANYCGI